VRLPFLVLSVALGFSSASCSRIFWRSGGFETVRVESEVDDATIDIKIDFKERDSLRPGATATLKKEFKTLLNRKGDHPAELLFGGWILTDSVVFQKSCFFLGAHGDDFDLSPHLYVWTSGEPREISPGEPGTIQAFTISPNEHYAAILVEDENVQKIVFVDLKSSKPFGTRSVKTGVFMLEWKQGRTGISATRTNGSEFIPVPSQKVR